MNREAFRRMRDVLKHGLTLPSSYVESERSIGPGKESSRERERKIEQRREEADVYVHTRARVCVRACYRARAAGGLFSD